MPFAVFLHLFYGFFCLCHFLKYPANLSFWGFAGYRTARKTEKNTAKAVYFVVSITNEHDLSDFEMS